MSTARPTLPTATQRLSYAEWREQWERARKRHGRNEGRRSRGARGVVPREELPADLQRTRRIAQGSATGALARSIADAASITTRAL